MATDRPVASHAVSVDGERLHFVTCGDGEEAVFVSHGLLASWQELTPLIHAIARSGRTAVALDYRGCGDSGGARGHTDPARGLEDARAIQAWAHGAGHTFVAAMGHSLGALFLLHFAHHGLAFPRYVLAAVPSDIKSELSALEHVGYRVGGAVNRAWMRTGRPSLRVPYKVDLKETIDDAACREAAEAWKFLQDTVPLSSVEPLLRLDGITWARSVRSPTLVLAADNDQVVSQSNTRAVYNALGGPKEWRVIPGGHSVFLDHGAEVALGAATKWCDGERLTAGPA